MVADEKFTIEIDYIENGFDAVIKHGKQVQKLGVGSKRFSQFQQSGITAQNRNEALARARAAKASEKTAKVAAKTASKTAAVTAKTAPIAAAQANRFPAGGISSTITGMPQTPMAIPPAHKLTGGGAALSKSQGLGAFSVLPNPAGNFNAQRKAATAPTKSQSYLNKFNAGMKKANMGLFKMQMASLGVYFSFMSIGMAITGLFTNLQNLGGAFKSMALGKAFGGVDILGGMKVEPGQLVEGWKNITGIMGMMQTTMTAIAAVALSPEVMKAVQEMFTKLAASLSDGRVAKALGDIIIAFTDLVSWIVDSGLLAGLADLISLLGDTGLLVPIIGLILGAQYLLATLSALGFALQSITAITTAYAWITTTASTALAGVGLTFGSLIAIIGLALVALDFVINLWENFAITGWSVATVVNALWDTFADLYNVLLPIMNLVGGAFGVQRAAFETNSGKANVQNNYNFNGNYDDPSALIKKTQKAQATKY